MPNVIVIDSVRLVLLGGLILHKALWEILKRGGPRRAERGNARQPLPVRLTKLVKIAILLGIVAQTITPVLFPMPVSARPLQTAGLAIYLIGLAIAVIGRLQLGNNWLDIEAAGVKTGQQTVSTGIYRLIRHPIYSGDLLLLLGLELALGSWLFIMVFGLALAVTRQAIQEERSLMESLPGYADYCRRTRRFIPYVV